MADFLDANPDYAACIHNFQVIDDSGKIIIELAEIIKFLIN